MRRSGRPGYCPPVRATGEVFELRGATGRQEGNLVIEHGYVKRAPECAWDLVGIRWTEAVEHLEKRGLTHEKLFHERKAGKNTSHE